MRTIAPLNEGPYPYAPMGYANPASDRYLLSIFDSVAQANRNRPESFYELGSFLAGLNKGDGLKLVRDDHLRSAPVTFTVPASSPACTGAKAKADS